MATILIWSVLAVALVTGRGRTTAKISKGRASEAEMAKFVDAHRLPFPADIHGFVLGLVSRREAETRRCGWIGLAVGIALGIAAWFAGQADLAGVLMVGCAGVGLAVGGCRGARAQHPPLAADADRIARIRAVDVSDYATVYDRRAFVVSAVTVVVALVAAGVVWWLVPVRPAGGVWLLFTLAACVAVVIATLVSVWREAARVVEAPQPATSDLELAWDDALRADAVRDLLDSGTGLGMIAVLCLLAAAGSWVLPWSVRSHDLALTAQLGVATFAVGLVCWAAVLVVWLPGRSRRNPSLDLWTPSRTEGPR